MEIAKIILLIQFIFSFTCLLIQFYALFSSRWVFFHTRVELGVIEERGHYGLWSMCTVRPSMSNNEFTDNDDKLLFISDCDSMDTYFTPSHSRGFIAFFAICHLMSLIVYSSLVLFRLIELYYKYWNKNDNDLEMNPNGVKRFLIIIHRLMMKRVNLCNDQEQYLRTQLRNKLYAISIAVLSTMLALAGAITPHQALRETDIFRINQVSLTNYQVWRGPGFWAQMTTMIMDMLITTLIVLEVRCIFVLNNQQQYEIRSNENRNENNRLETLIENEIVNPFFSRDNLQTNNHTVIIPAKNLDSKRPSRMVNLEMKTTGSQTTVEKPLPASPLTIATGTTSSSRSGNQPNYINSEEVRRMKNNRKIGANDLKETSYCNPMYNED